jgi:hypothetical protein
VLQAPQRQVRMVLRIGHDRCMDAAGDDVVIRLNHDEALVLYELLHRWEQRGQLTESEHHAEQLALWNLSALLERGLSEPFDPAYRRLISEARMRLAVNREPPSAQP